MLLTDGKHSFAQAWEACLHVESWALTVQLLAKRDELYRQARAANPSRWSGKTRNWERADSMTLNPDKTPEKLENAA